MRYVIFIAYEPGDWESASDAVRAEFFAAHEAFDRFVAERGRQLGGAALADAESATTVKRSAHGEPVISDGPFAELVEQIGGYYDVDLPDLDTAIEAASLLPAAYTVEIRPTITIEGYESP